MVLRASVLAFLALLSFSFVSFLLLNRTQAVPDRQRNFKMRGQTVSVSVTMSPRYEPNWESLDARPLPKWYDQAKFGIFLHWGVYSVPSYGGHGVGRASGEWFWEEWKGERVQWAIQFMKKNYAEGFTYRDFAPSFTAEFFDPDEWAELFQTAGARYVVLTSKHHDGWTNWKSKTAQNWNSVENGPHRDLVRALATSIRRKTSMHFGLYYSLYEWFNPLFKTDKAGGYNTQTYVKEVSLPQLHEIVNSYQPDLIWSDGDYMAPYTYWNSTEFLAWLYNDSPVKDTVVVNDRWGGDSRCKHGGYFTCHDRYNPGVLQKHKWENALTLDRHSWGYRREAVLTDYISTKELIQQLASTVSCGGNYLLNVGPTYDGRITLLFQERLKQIGSWLAVNGEAIYGSIPWAYQNDPVNPDVWYTQNSTSKAVYGILLKWPSVYTVTLTSVKMSSSSKVSLLGHGTLSWETVGEKVAVELPHLPPDSDLQWAWTLKFEDISPAG